MNGNKAGEEESTKRDQHTKGSTGKCAEHGWTSKRLV